MFPFRVLPQFPFSPDHWPPGFLRRWLPQVNLSALRFRFLPSSFHKKVSSIAIRHVGLPTGGSFPRKHLSKEMIPLIFFRSSRPFRSGLPGGILRSPTLTLLRFPHGFTRFCNPSPPWGLRYDTLPFWHCKRFLQNFLKYFFDTFRYHFFKIFFLLLKTVLTVPQQKV